jgi:hypothetical protein
MKMMSGTRPCNEPHTCCPAMVRTDTAPVAAFKWAARNRPEQTHGQAANCGSKLDARACCSCCATPYHAITSDGLADYNLLLHTCRQIVGSCAVLKLACVH